MSIRILLTAAFALLLAACAALPKESADVESYARREYRTGSNIPVKDYGAQNVEVLRPEAINPVNRMPQCRGTPGTTC